MFFSARLCRSTLLLIVGASLTAWGSGCGEPTDPPTAEDDDDDASDDDDDDGDDDDDDDDDQTSGDDDDDASTGDDDDDDETSGDDDDDDDQTSGDDDDDDDDETTGGDDDDDDDDDETTGGDDDDDDGKDTCDQPQDDDWADDNVAPSKTPPCGLKPSVVPMFVTIGFDDNDLVEGIDFGAAFADRSNPAGSGQAETYDGAPLSFAFYNTSTYSSQSGSAWKAAYDKGHEMGNHTVNHATSASTDLATWSSEMSGCNDAMVELGIPREELFGFRTPFLGTNDAMLDAVVENGFLYDTSLEEGFEEDQDGRNYFWPYTLDGGSPGNELLVEWATKEPVTPHAGLWEMPVYAVIAPPDDLCEKYGVESGFRDRLKAKQDYFDTAGGKITGFDYNLIDSTMFGMTNDEYAAVLMYTLDLRLEGNRAPFLFGGHTKNYGSYQAAIEEFIDYALTKEDVRIVHPKHILDWIRNPVALKK